MADTMNPQLLQHLLSLDPEEVVISHRVKRKDVSKIKAVRLSDQDALLVQDFQDYLVAWGYLPNNTFVSLFIYIFNLAFKLHKQVAEHQMKNEEQST